MWKSKFDYDPEKDKLPTNVTVVIVVTSIILAVYLSFHLV